jgi:alpha-L-rhamnosidase
VAPGTASAQSDPGDASLAVARMTTNGRVNPLGIAGTDISFGWSASASARGAKQSAYQLRVGTAPGLSDVWDSGHVVSDRQVDISLPPSVVLAPATRYHWQARVWDEANRAAAWSDTAWFETGLLSATDWNGAQWITRPVSAPDLNAWTNYSATVEFTLQSVAFGVLLRSSSDAQNAWMLQVDVSGSAPVFKAHSRVNGGYAVLGTVDLAAFGFTNASLIGSRHTLRFDVSGSTLTTRLDGTVIDTRGGVAPARGLVGFRTFGTEAGLVHRVTVLDQASGATLLDPDFSKGENGFGAGTLVAGALSVSGNTDAVFVNAPSSLPLLRGRFTARDGLVSARVYASALGLYEVSVNGGKAGDQFLAPGWTAYEKRIQAQTYDITSLVQPGLNVLGAALGDGWYRGKIGLGWPRVYGDQLAFVAKVRLVYADGSVEWFATDLTWKAADGPRLRSDLQDGETHQAAFEKPGWSTAFFDDSSWLSVGTVANLSSRLVPQPDEPVRAVALLTAKTRTEIQPGVWIYDLGQNMVGVPRVRLSGRKGDAIVLRHAEELYRVGARTGQIYTDNLRTAKATDTYLFDADGTVTFQPLFTQHGFRYIQITGAATPPAVGDVQGVVLSSDLPATGDLVTSRAMLNKLVSNIRWGQRGNFLSIPTDTPARDERLGWTGDINVFAPAAARFADTRAFLSKWMTDVRDAQKANGNLPAIVPQPRTEFDSTGVGWPDAAITVPYSVWQATGDLQIVRANWTAMKSFYAFVRASATGDGDLLEQGRSNWFSGDWLSLESVNRLEEHKVIGTAYFAENTRMMSEMAAALGDSALAAEWASLVPQIRQAFVNAYRTADGTIYTGTQTAYALALGMDMIADSAQRAQTATKFVAKLAADNNHLRTGFLGTPWLLPALSKIGREDLAMRLLLNETYPSWGFPISIGATTMWERWNSIQPNLEFGPVDMNSFNHYAYGAVGDWMFQKLGGIQALAPGYSRSRIAPLIGHGGLGEASCEQLTAHGRLATDWTLANGTATLRVEVPANTTAVIHVPAKAGTPVTESGVSAASSPGVSYLGHENGAALYEVGAGSYVFTSTPDLGAPAALVADPGLGHVLLSWTAAPGATSYDVKRSRTPGGPYTVIASGLATTSHTDSTVAYGAPYYYVVSARNAATSGADSAEAVGQPSLALNPGFETPTTATFVYNPAGGSWSFVGQAGIATNGSLFTSGNPAAPQGVQVAFLQGTGSLSQSFSGLTPGVKYTVTFAAAQRATGASWNINGQTWNLTVNGAVAGSFGPPQSATGYADYAATFTATSATHTLAFVGTNLRGGDNTVFIDKVRFGPGPLTPAQAWRQERFGTFANTGLAADEADPDSDALNNLLERAFGGNPSLADAELGPRIDEAASPLSVIYRRATQATDLDFLVEESADLASGWSEAAGTQELLSDDGAVQRVRFTRPLADSTRLFLRLKVAVR